MRPTGFEPAFSPAGSVGLERSPQGTKTLQSGRYQAIKEETQVSCGFRVHPTKLASICKNRGNPWHAWVPTVSRFWGNSSQTVVRGWAEREKSLGERGADFGEREALALGFVPVGKATAFLSRYLCRYFLHIVSSNAKSLHLFAKGVLSPLTCLCLYKVFAFFRIFS